MSKNRIGIILLLLLLTVGFATVTANLIINNNANISSNPDDFNVIFTSANAEEGGTATISNDKKKITYSTKELKNIGDKAELNYSIKNNSSQYDAEIDMDISFDNTYASYFKITYETFDDTNSVLIDAKEEKNGKIIIELIKPVIDDVQISLIASFNASAKERTSIAYENYIVRYHGNGSTSGSMDSQSINYGLSTSLLSNSYTKTDYTFAGWTDEENSKIVKYLNGEEVNSIADPNESIDLYAVWVKTKNDYSYRNSYYTYTTETKGKYLIELWGAQGGQGSGAIKAGNGAYVSGIVELDQNTNIYIYTGQQGVSTTHGSAWNGGGLKGQEASDGSGGGSTDVRLVSGTWNNFDSLKSRIMVAAGGGGSDDGTAHNNSGAGGGILGLSYIYNNNNYTNTTQTSGGVELTASKSISGTFGSGNTSYINTAAGGGGGYYGGGGTDYGTMGGSSFISGHVGCNAIRETSTSSSIVHTGQPNHYSGLVFTNTVMIDGEGYSWTDVRGAYVGQVQPNGTTSAGHTGNGYARITFIEGTK